MPELDKETTTRMNAVVEVRNVQLNEKVSETEYQILHPETKADQVITNELKRFVSDADKAKWNKSASDNINSIHYKGVWTSGVEYKKYDVVYYQDSFILDSDISNTTEKPLMFFMYINDTASKAEDRNRPRSSNFVTSTSLGDLWINIDFRSYLSVATQTVKVSKERSDTNTTNYVTFVSNTNKDYKTISVDDEFTYNPSINTLVLVNVSASGMVSAPLFKGDLDGTAQRAIDYVTYERDSDGIKIEGGAVGAANLDDTITGIKKTLVDITNGGAGIVLGNPLTITKDGDNNSAIVFDGSLPTIVDIKQTYTPEEISDLLDDTKKIKIKWLPESVLGQLEYQGTWNPGPLQTEINTSKQVKGYYFIAVGNGNFNPDGSAAAPYGTNPTYYLTGDWAVYNGTNWDKVDNTDAVTMVNGQIGAVEIYKTDGLSNYHRGDIVKYQDVLYICNETFTSSGIFSVDIANGYWDLFGRQYTATDAIKIEQNSIIKHDTVTPITTNVDKTLTKNQKISVPILTVDNWGHVSNIDIKNISLGEDFIDTVREVRVGNDKVLDKTDKNIPLTFKSTEWVAPRFENNILYFDHRLNGTTGAIDLTAKKQIIPISGEDVLYAGQGYSVPSFSIDEAGHVISGVVKNFKIADNFIKHRHFAIKKDVEGSQVICAYDATEATALWVNKSENSLKFYLGVINPTSTDTMHFNGIINATKFKQQGNSVIDTTAKIYHGINIVTNKELYGSFDAEKNAFISPDSGVVAGVYSAVAVNSKGIVSAGGHIVEFGKTENADPSDALAVGGLFFRLRNTSDANG